MEIKKYIKTIFKPAVAKRAKAMKRAKKARSKARDEAEKKSFAELEKKLGYSFADKSVLREALTHPGAVGTAKDKVRSNQRLEFLGDAILQAIITDTVYSRFDKLEEGQLTKIRIALTQGTFLAELSQGLSIPSYLILPKGAEELRTQASAAEDVFEAVVGAIYLDGGFSTARHTVLAWYRRKLEDLPDLVSHQNPKGALQELAAKLGDKIDYVLISQSGPDHKKIFEVEVVVGDKPYARASASSKKSAETKAASEAIREYAAVVAAKTAQTAETPAETADEPDTQAKGAPKKSKPRAAAKKSVSA